MMRRRKLVVMASLLSMLGIGNPGWAQDPSSPPEQPESSSSRAEQSPPQEGVAGPDQVQSRGLEVFGCPLSLDAGAMSRCFQRVLDREGDRIRDQMQREFDRNPFLAKLDHERKILQAVAQLPLQPLMTCLKNAPNQAQTDIGAQVQRWVADPGNYAEDAIQYALAQIRGDLAAILREEMQARQFLSTSPTPSQAWDRSVQMFDRLSQRSAGTRCLMQFISPHLPKLKQAMVQSHSAIASQFQQIFDPQTVAVVHQTRAQTVGRTLVAAAGGKPRPVSVAGTSVPVAPAPLAALPLTPPSAPLMQVKPGLIAPRGLSEEAASGPSAGEGEVTSRGTIQLGGGYSLRTPDPPPPPPLSDLVPEKASLAKMAKGMLAEALLDANFMQQLSTKVNQVAQVGTNPQAAQTAIVELRTLISLAQSVPPDARFDFGWEVLRYAGHRTLDQYGTSQAMANGTVLKDMVVLGVMAQCGIFPFVGGVTCAPPVWLAEVIAGTVVESISDSLLEGEHKDLDRVMTDAKGPIRAGRDPLEVQATTGSMGVLVRELPNRDEVIAFADGLLQNMYGPLLAYHQQVLMLAEAAVRR